MKLKSVVLMALFASGCKTIPVKDDKKEYDRGYEAAASQCHKEAEVVLNTLDQYAERLRKFNQLNDDGTLRNANPCFDNPKDPSCVENVTGKEPWQK